jgi:hypothetical protein
MIKKSKSGLLQSLLNEQDLNEEELQCLKNTLINAGINIVSNDLINLKKEIKNKSEELNKIISIEYDAECKMIKELCIR